MFLLGVVGWVDWFVVLDCDIVWYGVNSCFVFDI